MKRALFIDRDGTLIVEPPEDYQVDSLAKLAFVPTVFSGLGRIAHELRYELVMVTNQDGLGTSSFPEETFWPAHNQMLNALAGEGIRFAAEHIDRSFEHENKPSRKPGTAMLDGYSHGYDLANSYVIGDRLSDVQLAKNLGSKAIWFTDKAIEDAPEELRDTIALSTQDWRAIYAHLRSEQRRGQVQRTTKETDIRVQLALDGSGQAAINTGIGFFDHMLEQLARHGGYDLSINVNGDLHIDEHHTIEDTALALGEAFAAALQDKRSLQRYGFCLPMDDCLAQVAVDFGGRPWLVWEAEFAREKIGEMPTEMFMHFFKSFSDAARCNLNIQATGQNEHHKIEAIFKAWARALKMATALDGSGQLPSTKGVL